MSRSVPRVSVAEPHGAVSVGIDEYGVDENDRSDALTPIHDVV